MSLWKKSKSRKLQSLVLASLLALSVNNYCYADYWDTYIKNVVNYNEYFEVPLGSDSLCICYTPTDRVVSSGRPGSEITLDAGHFYIMEYVPDENNSRGTYTYTSLGEFNSMSEDELQQAIEDAVHNVDGDQTVTGDQTVDGEQTVKSVA